MANGLATVRRWFINGVVLTIPLVVTVIVLLVVLDFVLGLLTPVVEGVRIVWNEDPPALGIQLVTLAALIGFFLLVGVIADVTPGEVISQRFHATMETIPGLGTLYTSVRQASNVLADDEAEQFQDVKLVEFPHQDSYMIGFLTADTPPAIEDRLDGREMQTVMVPLGPNPTTNGFIIHLPQEDVHDVDVSIEEAFRMIATLGVTTDEIDDA